MSGHSKWSNIKDRKAAVDKKRSEVFTRLAKDLMTAVRQGGGNTNPESNSSLKTTIEKAKEMSMPKENISRLLERFETRKNSLSTFLLEVYGPFGIPMLLTVETDNKNRILAEIKAVLRKFGGNLGESGSVKFQFERVGELRLENITEADQLKLIDMGVNDFEGKKVWVEAESLSDFVKKVGKAGMTVLESGVVMKAKRPRFLNQEEREKFLGLVETLEENEDLVSIYTGAEGV
ncbi:YebC/PmpR family DNA-binding transcriptional regulator [Patescibacteria group bacterium]|nr:YebC/PmpR family DNA-binding transcriptional regulator [Patescibacteria group bacterium]